MNVNCILYNKNQMLQQIHEGCEEQFSRSVNKISRMKRCETPRADSYLSVCPEGPAVCMSKYNHSDAKKN